MENKSLKREILQVLIVFSILVIVVTGVLWASNLYKNKLDIIEHNQDQVLTQVEYEVNNFLTEISRISSLIKLNYDEDKTIIKSIVEINKNVSSILVLNDKGRIEDFYALSNLNIYKGFDYSNKSYFKKVKNKYDFYWSNVFLSTVDEEPSISFSFRFEKRVYVMMIKLSSLTQFISRFKNFDSSHMVRVFDSDGIIIINPDMPEIVLQRYNASSSEVFTKLINKVKPYEQERFKPIKNNTTQYGSYVNIEKTNWKIVVREDYSKVLDSLNSVVYTVVVFIGVFIVLSIFLSFKISRKIFTAFDKLQSTTKEIANGNYKVHLSSVYYEEFNNLISSFNKMKLEVDKREEVLEDSLSNFKTLFNSTMESIVLTENAVIIDVNDITLKLFDVDSKDFFVGKYMMNFIAPEYREIVKSNLHKSTEPYEVELIKADNTRLHVLVQGKFLHFQGREIRLTAIIVITELKQKDKLLFHQSKMASMGEMIGNIAHQWRQPLSVISTCASGVKLEKEFDTLSTEKLYSSIDIIVDNTKYLSKTIDDFRNFFQTDKEVNEFNISENINKALKLVNASLKNHDIKVIRIFDDELYIKGFENEFLQVLINIINNSKDAFIINNIEERIIEIITYKKNKNIVIEIKDSAGGIKQNIMEHIFDPYFTTKHQAKGTGIGLYMSHQIVYEHMNGEIDVKNTLLNFEDKNLEGCTFKIVLPIKTKKENIDYII